MRKIRNLIDFETQPILHGVQGTHSSETAATSTCSALCAMSPKNIWVGASTGRLNTSPWCELHRCTCSLLRENTVDWRHRDLSDLTQPAFRTPKHNYPYQQQAHIVAGRCTITNQTAESLSVGRKQIHYQYYGRMQYY